MTCPGQRRCCPHPVARGDLGLQHRKQGVQPVAGAGRQRQHALAVQAVGQRAVHHVALVEHHHGVGVNHAARGAIPLGQQPGIEHRQLQVGGLGAGKRPADTLGLDVLGGVAQAGGVGQHHRPAMQVQMHLDDVAGGAGGGRHDGGLAPGQPVEQAGLARIGGADDGDMDAVAQPLAAPSLGKLAGHVGDQGRHRRGHLPHQAVGHALVREVDHRFHQGQGAHQLGPPAFGQTGQTAVQLAQRLTTLGGGFRIHQIGDGLGTGQVQLAVQKGALGKLARLGRHQT